MCKLVYPLEVRRGIMSSKNMNLIQKRKLII